MHVLYSLRLTSPFISEYYDVRMQILTIINREYKGATIYVRKVEIDTQRLLLATVSK